MSKSNKYLGKLYEFLTLLQENLILKQQKMEEISMNEVSKMWELMGSNGETVQMDLSWVSTKEDVDNLINAIDGLKKEIVELQYGDISSLADSCAADWYSVSRDSNNNNLYNVYGYVGNTTNIIVPAKINKPSAYGCLNARYQVMSGGTPSDNYKLGNANTEKIVFAGDFYSASFYWKEYTAKEIIGLEKLNVKAMPAVTSTTKYHIANLKELDLSKTSVNPRYGKTWDQYYTENPSEVFSLIKCYDTPNLERVILPVAIKDAIDTLISGDYDLMTKIVAAYPNFKEFKYI